MAPSKVEEVYEKVEFSGKIFMYCTPGWDVLYPVVDLIRLFKPDTVIAHKNGKGQQTVVTYGIQYGHRVTGYHIVTKDDYIEALRMVKCVCVFTDTSDSYAETFINMAKTMNILLICYSNLDKVYHFYNGSKELIKTAQETVEKMYSVFDKVEAKRFADMFPDFEIIEADDVPKQSVLEECLEKLRKTTINEKKKKELTATKIYDPHLAKLKKMENDRKKVVYDDDIHLKMKSVNIFSKFT